VAAIGLCPLHLKRNQKSSTNGHLGGFSSAEIDRDYPAIARFYAGAPASDQAKVLRKNADHKEVTRRGYGPTATSPPIRHTGRGNIAGCTAPGAVSSSKTTNVQQYSYVSEFHWNSVRIFTYIGANIVNKRLGC
jgi:hypothetical protein